MNDIHGALKYIHINKNVKDSEFVKHFYQFGPKLLSTLIQKELVVIGEVSRYLAITNKGMMILLNPPEPEADPETWNKIVESPPEDAVKTWHSIIEKPEADEIILDKLHYVCKNTLMTDKTYVPIQATYQKVALLLNEKNIEIAKLKLDLQQMGEYLGEMEQLRTKYSGKLIIHINKEAQS